MKKKKLATSVAALATAGALLLGGTFAWQSINQTALNESSDVVNPGGRLHNDMWYVSAEKNNNDIYVENFATEEIFARVRLSEYMEIVLNKGTPGEISKDIIGTKTEIKDENGAPVLDANGNKTYDYEYVRFNDYESRATDLQAGAETDAEGNATNHYWTWQMGGETVYMPTFNMNKDSLLPDLNGVYEEGRVGTISNRVPADDPEHQYSDWKDWANEDDPIKTANEIWDYDSNSIDELENLSFLDLDKIIDGADDAPAYDENAVKLVNDTHEAKSTQSAELISMSDWLSLFDDGNGGYDATRYDPAVHGNYWVYDDTADEDGDGMPDGDGWVYWSAKLAGGQATGLLLDGTTLNQVMDDTWYYAIEAVGQFCTPDDTGVMPTATLALDEESTNNGTGFYADGETVTENAQEFLRIIGSTDTTPGYDEEELAMTFSSSPEYNMGEDGPYVEIPMSSSEPFTWNLYDCSEGEFTLSSNNPAVTFEPYGDDENNQNVDMNIVIPAGTTENFTVTATAVESGKEVTFTVIMVENTEPAYSIALSVAEYIEDGETEGYGGADHLAVNKEYSLRAYVLDDEENPADHEDEDYAVNFTVTLDNGEPLTEGDDYTLTIKKPQFEEETVTTEDGEERIEYAAYADLTILNEDLIGEFATVEVSTPNGKSDSLSDVVIQEHRIELAVQLFDTDSGAEFTDFVVGPNQTYDVRVTANIEDDNIGEIVIFDSRETHQGDITPNIEGFDHRYDLDVFGAGVSINENGQFVTGENPGYDWDEYGNFHVDATIKDLRIMNGETIRWRGYATGTTDWMYQKEKVQLEFCDHADQFDINAYRGKNGGVPLMVGLSTAWEVEGITFTVEGNADLDTKIVPMEDEGLKYESYYYRLILGENETADMIKVTAKKAGYIDSDLTTFEIFYPTPVTILVDGAEVDPDTQYKNTQIYQFSIEEDVYSVIWSIDTAAEAAGVTIDTHSGMLDAQTITDDLTVTVTATPHDEYSEINEYSPASVTFNIDEVTSGME